MESPAWSTSRNSPSLLKHSRALVWQNIPSYGGGNDIWGGEAAGFEPQSFHDGLLELMSLGSTSEVAVHKATSGAISSVKRCAQSPAYDIKFNPGVEIFMQVDGEAVKCIMPVSATIRKSPGRARMLSKSNIKTLNGSSLSLMSSPSNNAEEQAAAGSQGDTTHLDAISVEGGDDTGDTDDETSTDEA